MLTLLDLKHGLSFHTGHLKKAGWIRELDQWIDINTTIKKSLPLLQQNQSIEAPNRVPNEEGRRVLVVAAQARADVHELAVVI